MKLWNRIAASAAAMTAALGVATAGHAAIIDWTLSNGTFDDGGIFAGTFTFDSATDTITDWNVTTTGVDGSSYQSPASCFLFFCNGATDNGSGPSFSDGFFIFGSTFSLTNIAMGAPGSVAHLTGGESGIVGFPFAVIPFSRNVTDGQAVGVAGGVPEPAEWTLMIGGLALAGAALRARRRLAAA